MTTLLRSGCKVNLSLDITGRLPNGYHELESLFLPLDEPHDELLVSTSEGTGITVSCEAEGIDLEHNTLTKAYTLYATATGFAPGMNVTLTKGVPHGAGLGGGSADAATLLKHIDSMNPSPLGTAGLIPVASKVGADVPFFLMNVPCIATGIGEKLVPAENPYKGMWLVLACPKVCVSTPWAYAAWDAANESDCEAEGCLTTQGRADKNSFSRGSWLFNSFERVVFTAYPELNKLKEAMLRDGAAAALMSGSGAGIFALFRAPHDARTALSNLEAHDIVVYQHLL